MRKQTKEMKEQTALLAGEVATLREGLEAKLQQDIQEAIMQLSEVIIIYFQGGSHFRPFGDNACIRVKAQIKHRS